MGPTVSTLLLISGLRFKKIKTTLATTSMKSKRRILDMMEQIV